MGEGRVRKLRRVSPSLGQEGRNKRKAQGDEMA